MLRRRHGPVAVLRARRTIRVGPWTLWPVRRSRTAYPGPDAEREHLFVPLHKTDPEVADRLARGFVSHWLELTRFPSSRFDQALQLVDLRVAPEEDEPGLRRLRLTFRFTGSTRWLPDWSGSVPQAEKFLVECADLEAGWVEDERRLGGRTWWDEEAAPPQWVADVTPAGWIGPRLHPFATDVGSVIPTGFAGYARILHPVRTPAHRHLLRRWSDIARDNGRLVHPEMQFHLVSKPVGGPEPPEGEVANALSWGSFPYPERVALSSLLERFTSTPERCWFCVWEGYGLLDDRGVSARVELPQRNYLLYRADLARAVDSVFGPGDQSPNLWWPDDQAWFVATEIDYAWTYVGGPRELIGEILASPWLEALPARLTDLPFRDADRLNAALDGVSEPDEDSDHRA